LTTFFRVEGVSAIVVFTNIVANNWRLLELYLGSNVSLIILVVGNTSVFFLLCIWIKVPIVVAITEPCTVKTSCLTAVVVAFAGEISLVGIAVLSPLPAAISPTMRSDSRACGGERTGGGESSRVGGGGSGGGGSRC